VAYLFFFIIPSRLCFISILGSEVSRRRFFFFSLHSDFIWVINLTFSVCMGRGRLGLRYDTRYFY